MNHDSAAPIEPILSGYQLRLPTYEGPLDVLLRLIERSQLAIADVSLVAVTDQFLEHIAGLGRTPPVVIAEFAAVGSRLTVLKSRSLLPRPPVVDEEPEQSDLTIQLREYKRLKEFANHLGARHAGGLSSFAPLGRSVVVPPPTNGRTRLATYGADVLARSIRRRLAVVPRAAQVIRYRRVVSLHELVARVASMVTAGKPTRFSAVVADYASRSEVATAFLAVLVLMRRGQIEVNQVDLFAEMSLSATASETTDRNTLASSHDAANPAFPECESREGPSA